MIKLKKFYQPFFSESQIQKVWEKALVIEGIDPQIYRLDNCGALIKNVLYLNEFSSLSMGWEIDLIQPRSKGGTDDLPNLQALQWENKKAKAECYPFWKCIVSEDRKGNCYLK
ncbi:MAG: HNH endonuclease [Bacteroidota bacterium]